MKMETQHPKSMGCSKSSFKKEVHSERGLPQETRIFNKQHNLPPKGNRKRRKTKPKVRRKEVIKISE